MRDPAPSPTFRDLTPDECAALLARNRVMRLAYSFRNRVDIEPVHYAYADGWVYVRTAAGTKLETILHHPWVAFEVDEVEDTFEWRSVVGHGSFLLLERDGAELVARAWERAIASLRSIVPETWASSDPVAFRNVVFGIHVNELRGRAASPPRAMGTVTRVFREPAS